MHVEDLIEVEKQLGYSYEMSGPVEHYQWICPPCRRSLFVVSQGRVWGDERGESFFGVEVMPVPTLGNAGLNQGPLGDEDRRNFHP
jgi:hypothetical protein